MNKSTTILWVDEDNRDSYKLCMKHYGLKCLQALAIDPHTVEITVYGPTENVKLFADDYADGSCEPLESMSRSLEFDEDYQATLRDKLSRLDA